MNPLFNSKHSNVAPADTKNAAGGIAYKLDSQVALAKYVCTGTFNDIASMTAEAQVAKVLTLCKESAPEYIAKLAVYARQEAQMKDTPAFLLAYLTSADLTLAKKIFSRVIDSPKMLRNFMQIMRSGEVGRKSLGTAPKKMVQHYLNSLSDEQLFKANIGNSPSLSDIIKMMRPKPLNKERETLYAYLLGRPLKPEQKENLLPLAKEFEAFKSGESKQIPKIPFEMLTALPLSDDHWKEIAANATFNQMRMNLNTFKRHNVFNDPKLVERIAAKLGDADEVRRSKVMPYQLFTTFLNIEDMPQEIKNALSQAVEVSLDNIPEIDGTVYIALDTSGSMANRVTGNRGSVTTKARYIDVGALFAAAILRKNKNAVLVPFDTQIHNIDINPFDSIMTNAAKLRALGGGGTDCSLSLAHLNNNNMKGSCVIYISDNESWRAYARRPNMNRAKGTGMMQEWEIFVKKNPNAKLINIDISPLDTTQVADVPGTLLISGFNDAIFTTIYRFMRNMDYHDHWMKTISGVQL